ncbi:hypothetical protein ACFQ88_05295 [Paenibacillus sp. NPDC056579]|uniref:hypothetical protein n=1 Tax=Paenibacillus sp. NPDC056579 TaxID=3345871 RepID=UPI0036A9F381
MAVDNEGTKRLKKRGRTKAYFFIKTKIPAQCTVVKAATHTFDDITGEAGTVINIKTLEDAFRNTRQKNNSSRPYP